MLAYTEGILKGLNVAPGLTLPIEAITNTFAIFGIRGSGKSNIGAVMAEGIIKAGQPVCIIDPTGSWYGLKSSADGKAPGLPVYVFGGEHADIPLEPTAGEVVANFVVENRVPVVLDLKLMRKYQQVQFVTAFSETLYHRNREPLMVFVDEAARFAPQMVRDRGPDTARCLGALEDITGLGRTRGLGMTIIGQRPAPISTTVRTQCETLICLRTIGKHDRKAIDEWVEAKGTQEERNKMMADVAELPNGTGYFWSPSFLGKFLKTNFFRRTTFDSGATPKIGQKVIIPKAFAEIDKGKLSQQIQDTIERAKADDPKELRKKIAELQKEVATAKKSVPSPTLEIKRVEVPVLKDSHVERLEALIERATKAGEYVLGSAREIAEALRSVKKEAASTVVDRIPQRPMPVISRPAQAQPKHQNNGNANVGGLARKILTVLAQYPQGMGVDRLAILANSTVNGHFNSSVSSLRTSGYLTPARVSPIQITQEGIAALGDYEPMPVGEGLRQYWMNRLGGLGSKILRSLIAQYPDPISVEDLAASCDSTVNGHFNSTVSSLRTMGLMTPARTPIKASDYLFEE